ncbi:hypothetical protein BST85_01375 [Aureitalea marina]|uniref:Zinc-dependent peptidase n=1 Tax=Aureitalea marina TaxID=930804 RepID=A0A2S7KTD9_9FLAO|nr:hypothetical protein BST85_01375 [Aureitalea marina]
MAPYAYVIVLLGFGFVLFRLFESWYAAYYQRPLYRHWRVFRTLNPDQLAIIKKEVLFFGQLSKQEQRQFEHRVATFLQEKEFVGRDGLDVTPRMKVLISSLAILLSFGRKNYLYNLISFILIYPGEFYSNINETYHLGEFNPREKALVLSWTDFEKGISDTSDNRNLGIHEFMHAMQLEARSSKDLDASRFARQFQNILKYLTQTDVRDRLNSMAYFRDYAFTNQYEFMAVLAEYFIESPKEFEREFPELYDYTRKLLNFHYAHYRDDRS